MNIGANCHSSLLLELEVLSWYQDRQQDHQAQAQAPTLPLRPPGQKRRTLRAFVNLVEEICLLLGAALTSRTILETCPAL